MEERLKGKRILIVDDEVDILDTLKDLLDMCTIYTAPNFETARKFLEKETFDAAILDIMGVNGFELLKLCVEKKIDAVMLTAHATVESAIEGMKFGAFDYLMKPCDMDQLIGKPSEIGH